MLEVDVSKRDAYLRIYETLTSGSVGIKVKINFSKEWFVQDDFGNETITKAVVFIADDTKYLPEAFQPPTAENPSCIVTIPHECLTDYSCALIMGVRGTNARQGSEVVTEVIPTIYVSLGEIVEGTTVEDAENTGNVTSSLVDQVIAGLQSIQSTESSIELAERLRDDAESARIENETDRVSEELIRQANEEIRQGNERDRESERIETATAELVSDSDEASVDVIKNEHNLHFRFHNVQNTQSAGLIDYDPEETYPEGSIGAALNNSRQYMWQMSQELATEKLVVLNLPNLM